MNKNLGEFIKQTRIEKNMTRAELAKKANISYASIINFETSKVAIRPQHLKKIADALEVDYKKLYNLLIY